MEAAFNRLKANLEPNPSFQEKITQHHNAVRRAVQNALPGSDTKLIGSLARRTRIQPRDSDTFDIDILVVLGGFTGWGWGGVSPAQALQNVHGAVAGTDRYGQLGPGVDAPTVTFRYSDGVKVELVPAYRNDVGSDSNGTPYLPIGRGYWIPRNGQWVFADYDHEAEYVTLANDASGGSLVPLIKMLKALRRTFFPQLESFPLEIIATRTMPGTWTPPGETPWPYLMEEFFPTARGQLLGALSMPGSKSPPILLDQQTRLRVDEAFRTLGEFASLANAEVTNSAKVDRWKTLFGDLLPRA